MIENNMYIDIFIVFYFTIIFILKGLPCSWAVTHSVTQKRDFLKTFINILLPTF